MDELTKERKRKKSSPMPVALGRRLIKEAGAYRVSDDAALALGEALKEKGLQLCQRAVAFSTHAGRKTITRADVELAAKGI